MGDRAVPYRHPQTLKLCVADITEGKEAWRRLFATRRDVGEAQRGPSFQPSLRPGFPILPATDCVVLASSPEAAETAATAPTSSPGQREAPDAGSLAPPVSGGAGWPRPLALLESLPSAVDPRELYKVQCSGSLPFFWEAGTGLLNPG